MTTPTSLFATATAAAALALALAGAAAAPRAQQAPTAEGVQAVAIDYTAHDGRTSHATILLPAWYAADRNPAIPLVISPHGRGLWGSTNAELWGDLPTRGGFAVVNPDGEGEHLSGRFSWGAPGDVDDLARMPEIVQNAVPWLRIDTDRIYAVGGSMGGQETLLLIGRHPDLLAGAVAVDPAVDFARRYRDFTPNTRSLARREVGGTPATTPDRYAERTVFTYVDEIANAGVRLQIWWSRTDKIIVDSRLHSGALVEQLRRANPTAPLVVHTGSWPHTHPLRWDRRLPEMLAGLGLLDR